MKEHMDVYENIDSSKKLRNHVMGYALKKLRVGGKTTTNTGMDLSAVVKELEERLIIKEIQVIRNHKVNGEVTTQVEKFIMSIVIMTMKKKGNRI